MAYNKSGCAQQSDRDDDSGCAHQSDHFNDDDYNLAPSDFALTLTTTRRTQNLRMAGPEMDQRDWNTRDMSLRDLSTAAGTS